MKKILLLIICSFIIPQNPEILVSPTELNFEIVVWEDSTQIDSLIIENNGSSDLEWEAAAGRVYGNGLDGELYIPNGQVFYIDEVKSQVVDDNYSGSNFIYVSNSDGFEVGQEILIISMQDPNTNFSANATGTYETHHIQNINESSLTLSGSLENNYLASADAKHQVIKVPNYTNVIVDGTLTCSSWDGSTGGVMFYRANGTTYLNNSIDVSGKGYRGGESPPPNTFGQQGESIIGTGTNTNTSNYSGGGGGFSAYWPSGSPSDWVAGGGGGGSFITIGSDGYECGSASFGTSGVVNDNYSEKLILGSGGGAGGTQNDGVNVGGGIGGNGGGIIYISSVDISGSGSIYANGSNGGNAGTGDDGGGGAGSGGTIIVTSSISFDENYDLSGGSGGNGGTWCTAHEGSTGGDGGYGGDGLFVNLIVQHMPNWVDFSLSEGVISPNNTQVVYVTANSNGYECGAREESIIISHNDPSNEQIEIPLSMNVLYPTAVFDETQIDFGELSYNESISIEIPVLNDGCYPLETIAGLTNQNLLVTPDTLVTEVGEIGVFTVTFTSDMDEMDVEDTLILNHNDPFNNSDTIQILGTIVPDIYPIIVSVEDVPNDQGGWVNIEFTGSNYDSDTLRVVESYTVEANYGNGWIISGSGNAYGNDRYVMQIHTQVDSSSSSSGLVDFRVIAGMDEGNFASDVVQGYSVDNINPSTPTDLLGSHSDTNLILQWNYNEDIDFDYHRINDIWGVDRYSTVNELNFAQNEDYDEYNVQSVDIHGNLSNESNLISSHQLHFGANLISFPILAEDRSPEVTLESLGSNGISIIGEGVAAQNLGNGLWVGSLSEVSHTSGYWVKSTSDDVLFVSGLRECEELSYNLNTGPNLKSYCCEQPGDLNLIPDECGAILGEGVAAQRVSDGWVGSLDQLYPGKGYWIKCSEEVQFNWECPE